MKGNAGIAEKSKGLNLLETYKNKFSTVECTLGKIYYYGEFGVDSNMAKGLQLIRNAADRGNLYALHLLGEINFKEKKYSEAFSCYKKAADKGFPLSLRKLAMCYNKGWGCEKSSVAEKEIEARYKKSLPCEIIKDGTKVIHNESIEEIPNIRENSEP